MRQIDRGALRQVRVELPLNARECAGCLERIRERGGREFRVGERVAADQENLLARELRGEFIERRIETAIGLRLRQQRQDVRLHARIRQHAKREHRQHGEHQHAPADETQAQRRARRHGRGSANKARTSAPGGSLE